MPRPEFSPTRLARNGASPSSWRIGPAPRARSASLVRGKPGRSYAVVHRGRLDHRRANAGREAAIRRQPRSGADFRHDGDRFDAHGQQPAIRQQHPGADRDVAGDPGKYAWTSGPTLPRYIFSAFLKQHDLKMNFVSYRDASQPQADLGEGRIQALLTSLTASSSPVQAGKARFLAVVNPSRAATLPDVKTARELGYPELEIEGLAGIFGSKTHARGRAKPNCRRRCRDLSRHRCSPQTGGRRAQCVERHDRGTEGGDRKAAIRMNELAKIIDIRNPQ